MFHRSHVLPSKLILPLVLALLLNSSLLAVPHLTPAVQAQAQQLTLEVVGPTYVRAGQNITYELILQNLSSQLFTNIVLYNYVPANTTHVSGGTLLIDDNSGLPFVSLTLPSLAAHATQTVSWVTKANAGLAVGTSIDNDGFGFIETTPGAAIGLYAGVSTLVEAPGTVVASLKNASNRGFDVMLDGFGFANYTNEVPRVSNDDLAADDLFLLFGPAACTAGTTAATCKLSQPAQKWMETQISYMNGGHCDGFSVASLRFFERLSFKGKTTPANFQAGKANTTDLTFPAQPIENYIAYAWTTQQVPEVSTNKVAAGPKELVNKLIADFNHSPSLSYAVHIFKLPGWKAGHSIAAYGVESVNANESRILVYDNNYPKQRQYITVNMAANTWQYITAATPGNPPDVYEGTATSGNLSLVANSLRDRPAGQYFTCPFCSTPASLQAAAAGQITGEITFQFTGEGAIVVINDAGQKTGIDVGNDALVEEIPNAELLHFNGGLGKEIPPRITVPFTETAETRYTVVVHGTTVTTPTHGALSIHGAGFHMGVDNIALDPNEVLTFTVSPDGDHISFVASENVTAPAIHIAHDPVHDGDPSVVFEVTDEILFAGERISLDLDPALERIHIADSGLEEEDFNIIMHLVWPDGDEHVYTETLIVPAGATSALIDFGAWDGLLHPPTYIDDVLQNPSVNHRLMLQRMSGVYDATPQTNAPAGVYHVDATFTNVTEVQLTDLYFTVADLAAGNVLLNADGSPAGQGAKLSLPNTALGEDGLLHVNESVTVRFTVGLANADTSALTINANGVPHDWTHEAPPLAGQANNASFLFTVRADNPLYLPLVAK